MVARWTRIGVLAAVVVILGLGGCALKGTSIEDRVNDFIAELQAGSYSGLYKHLHEDCTERSAAVSGVTFWNTTPFNTTDAPFMFTSLSYGGSTTATFESDDVLTPTGITFEMQEEDSDDWFIRRILIPGLIFTLE